MTALSTAEKLAQKVDELACKQGENTRNDRGGMAQEVAHEVETTLRRKGIEKENYEGEKIKKLISKIYEEGSTLYWTTVSLRRPERFDSAIHYYYEATIGTLYEVMKKAKIGGNSDPIRELRPPLIEQLRVLIDIMDVYRRKLHCMKREIKNDHVPQKLRELSPS